MARSDTKNPAYELEINEIKADPHAFQVLSARNIDQHLALL